MSNFVFTLQIYNIHLWYTNENIYFIYVLKF